MKIIYFLDIKDNYLGGAGNVLIEQSNLMQEDEEVFVVLPCDAEGNYNQEYKRRCEKYGLAYGFMQYDTSSSMKYTNIISTLQHWEEIADFLKVQKPDVIHSVQLNPAVELAARSLGIPHLMNIYQLHHLEFRIKYHDIYPHFHSADSKLYCNIWSENMSIVTRCIRPYVAISSEKKSNRLQEGNDLYIGLAGTLSRGKNQLLALQAIDVCRRRQLSFKILIAGYADGPYARECFDYVKEHHLEGRVEFLGFTSRIEEDFLDKIDVFMCVSKYESFPCSIVEAVTKNIPVISVPVAGVPEVFQHGYNAYISTDYEVDSLVSCIRQCSEDMKSGSIEVIKRNALLTHRKFFSKEAVKSSLKSYYAFLTREERGNADNSELLEAVKRHIQPIYERLIQRKNLFTDYEYVKKNIWYYSYLDKILKKGRVYIWGAGKAGMLAYHILTVLWTDLEVIGFIDNRLTGALFEKKIVRYEDADLEETDYIFLAFGSWKEDVIDNLEQRGLRYNIRVFEL